MMMMMMMTTTTTIQVEAFCVLCRCGCDDDDDDDDDDTGGSVLCAVQVWVWQVSGQQPVSTCRVCERRPSSCRRIAGLYTVTVLTKGTYNPVVEIPPEACSINITELAPSQNYLGQCP